MSNELYKYKYEKYKSKYLALVREGGAAFAESVKDEVTQKLIKLVKTNMPQFAICLENNKCKYVMVSQNTHFISRWEINNYLFTHFQDYIRDNNDIVLWYFIMDTKKWEKCRIAVRAGEIIVSTDQNIEMALNQELIHLLFRDPQFVYEQSRGELAIDEQLNLKDMLDLDVYDYKYDKIVITEYYANNRYYHKIQGGYNTLYVKKLKDKLIATCDLEAFAQYFENIEIQKATVDELSLNDTKYINMKGQR
jgi:hypothetical protein